MDPFVKRVLIANRGEIAVRIARACAAQGIATIAVHSENESRAQHVLACDQAVCIGAPTAYLDAERLIAAARDTGADAIHPGYGFLSEDADFAQTVTDAGLVWIGPSPESIRAMGDKIDARARMEGAGVPLVPGANLDDADVAQWRAAAQSIGYPVLVKASAGGGGKGMQAVFAEDELEAAVSGAKRVAGAAFGDATVYLEKLLLRPRHIEIQVFGDSHGNCVHLGERECSIQRRHQKVLEEAPAFGLDRDTRQAMGAAAVAAAKAVSYVGAGTVEFLRAETGEFYFLEMNTRLQVEHPVTEEVFGVDLVAAQLAVARGEALTWRQEELEPRGHAIEVRLYAEDATQGFLPATGELLRYRPPTGPGVRHDGGYAEGDTIGTDFDPMLAKLIVYGPDRPAAIGRLQAALDAWEIHGCVTNLDFLRWLSRQPAFVAGETHTGFLDEHLGDEGLEAATPTDDALIALAVAECLQARVTTGGAASGAQGDWVSPWTALGSWRGRSRG